MSDSKQKKLNVSDKKQQRRLKDYRQPRPLRSLGLRRKTPNASEKRLKKQRDLDLRLRPLLRRNALRQRKLSDSD